MYPWPNSWCLRDKGKERRSVVVFAGHKQVGYADSMLHNLFAFH